MRWRWGTSTLRWRARNRTGGLAVAFDGEPSSWRRFAGSGGARLVLSPTLCCRRLGRVRGSFLHRDRLRDRVGPPDHREGARLRRYWHIRARASPLALSARPLDRATALRSKQLVMHWRRSQPRPGKLFSVVTADTAVAQILVDTNSSGDAAVLPRRSCIPPAATAAACQT